MPKEMGHYGTRSWWNGVFKTLCGLRIPKTQGASTWTTPVCPECAAAKKAGAR